MYRLLATTALVMAISSPAWAIADQDNSAISVKQAQEQAQAQSSVNRNVNTNASTSRATGGKGGAGGNASTGPVTVNVENTTPASGASPQAAQSSQGHHNGSGQRGTAGNVNSGNTTINAPPALGLALAPSSGTGCGSEGIGAGGAGPAAGGLLSYTWEAPNCTAMQYAQMLDSMGHRAAALYVLNSASDTVHKALEWEAQHQPVAPVAPPVAPFIDGFCRDNPSMCDGSE